MSDTKCAHCGAGMHRLTRWCQKCGKSAGNPVIPITYPTQPVSTTPSAITSFPPISFSQTAPEPASMPFTSAPPPPPAPTPSESGTAFNFLPQSMQPETKSDEGTAKSGSAFNFLPQSMQPAQKPVADTNGYQVPEYAAVDQGGYAAEQFDSSGVWQEGNLVVAIKDATFPNRCVKCNDVAETNRIARKLTWHHPLIYALVLFSPLVYAIVALILRKKAALAIPLCTRHKSSRKMIMAGGTASILLAFPLMIASVDLSSGVGVLISIVMLFAGIIICNTSARVVTPTKIDDQYIWVKGVCQEFRQQLPSV